MTTTAEQRRRNLDAFLGLSPATEPIPYAQSSGYDYRHQAWVMDGVYLDCHHTFQHCGCYGRTHKGQPVAADAEIR